MDSCWKQLSNEPIISLNRLFPQTLNPNLTFDMRPVLEFHHSEKSPVKMMNPPFLSQNRFRQNRVTTTTDPESCLTHFFGSEDIWDYSVVNTDFIFCHPVSMKLRRTSEDFSSVFGAGLMKMIAIVTISGSMMVRTPPRAQNDKSTTFRVHKSPNTSLGCPKRVWKT